VVLRNTGFHLAHEVGAHVGRLRVDAATQLGEQRYKASAEPESDDARWRELRVRPVGEVDTGHAQEAQCDDEETGDRAPPERDRNGIVQTVLSRRRGANI